MSSAAVETTPTVATAVKDATAPARTKQPPLWNVILLDDDDHSYEYVMRMMLTLFGHPLERGYTIACEVDSAGRAICATYHKELAELKQEQVHAFGRDPLMARSAGAMSAVIEPALGSGDESSGSDGERP